ncbi:hypothetical protein [Streptomyces lutosisoli]|uniref:Uncharacterized protein n=1 Tax=Streptomyces lutosisoli TaxID=2665721 RepID=A0ABW2VS19_9ACTN
MPSERKAQGARIRAQCLGNAQRPLPRTETMVEIIDIKMPGVGPRKAEAGQKLGGRLPQHRLVVDPVVMQKRGPGLVELDE